MNLFLIYMFIKRLSTPFKDWEAFSLGIIDDEGNVLKSRKDLRTVKERKAYGLFDNLIRKLKIALEKVPGGKSRLASYAAALWLLKENEFLEEYGDMLSEDEVLEHFNDYYIPLTEEVSVAGGTIVGTEPGAEPIVRKKKKILRRK